MPRTSKVRALRSTQTSPNAGTVRDHSTFGSTANNATTAAFAAAGASSWQFSPNTGGTSGGTAPSAPASAITGRGWRDVTGEDALEEVTYAAGTWSLQARVNKTAMAINANVTVRVTAIVFQVTSAGAIVGNEIGRVVFSDVSFATVGATANASGTFSAAARTFAAADKVHTEWYVQNIVAGIPAAPVAAYTVALTVDDTQANGGSGVTSLPTYTTRFVRSLSVSQARTVALGRLLTLTRSYSVNQARTVTATRLLSLARSFTVDQARTVTAARVASLLRSHSVNVARTVAFSRALTLTRSYTVNVDRSVAMTRLLTLLRSFTVNQARTVGFARAVISARAFTVNVARTVSMRIELPQAVLNRMTPGGGGGTTIIRKIFAVFDD